MEAPPAVRRTAGARAAFLSTHEVLEIVYPMRLGLLSGGPGPGRRAGGRAARLHTDVRWEERTSTSAMRRSVASHP